jgi:hypothetical protein
MGFEGGRVHGGTRRQHASEIPRRIPWPCAFRPCSGCGGKRDAGKASADPPDLAFFIEGAGRVGIYDLAASIGGKDIWDVSASAVLQLFHAEATRKGARLRWVNWPEASQEIIDQFEELANREVILEGL